MNIQTLKNKVRNNKQLFPLIRLYRVLKGFINKRNMSLFVKFLKKSLSGLIPEMGYDETQKIISKFRNHLNNENFRFIQIGSNDGITGDPLHSFINRYNWNGVLIEPVPYLFENLVNNYKNKQNLYFENLAISDKNTNNFFYRLKKIMILPLQNFMIKLVLFIKILF